MAAKKEEDAYAAKYMAGAGGVLLRDKFVGRWQLAIVGLAALACGASAVATFAGLLPKSSPAVALLLTAMTAFLALVGVGLSVVRTVVSDRELFVQCGLWGPRVPLDRIRTCRVVPYDWARFGGWGIKRSGDGTWAYVLTAKGDVVEVTWTADDGSERAAQFSASRPDEVVAAVERARAQAVGPKVRIDASALRADSTDGEAVGDDAEPEGARAKRSAG